MGLKSGMNYVAILVAFFMNIEICFSYGIMSYEILEAQCTKCMHSREGYWGSLRWAYALSQSGSPWEMSNRCLREQA